MVGDFDDLGIAIFWNYFGACDVSVGVNAGQDGALGLVVRWIFEIKSLRIGASELQERPIWFFPGHEFRREVPEVEIDATGFFDEGENLNGEHLVVLDDAKIAQHHAGFGCHPDLLGNSRAPFPAPAAFEPSEVRKLWAGNKLRRSWRGGCVAPSGRNRFRLRVCPGGLSRGVRRRRSRESERRDEREQTDDTGSDAQHPWPPSDARVRSSHRIRAGVI